MCLEKYLEKYPRTKEAQRCVLQQMPLLKQGVAARGDLRLGKQKKISLLVPPGDPSTDSAPPGLRQLWPQLSAWRGWELRGACSHPGCAPDVLCDLAQITSPPCFGFAARNTGRKQTSPCSQKVSDAHPAPGFLQAHLMGTATAFESPSH